MITPRLLEAVINLTAQWKNHRKISENSWDYLILKTAMFSNYCEAAINKIGVKCVGN
jgi:hypothetical protein